MLAELLTPRPKSVKRAHNPRRGNFTIVSCTVRAFDARRRREEPRHSRSHKAAFAGF
ncbi:hypothetical protein BN2476_1240058 [Paraburkholderia piptadeniae]|uniref:Uncharacterized protein n=1 Tax=Paraburkholderia piptadeniae TaxID=1701573 RepID=A0A1N7SW65_9BURK|nr:hypothetical protein BN2476_1240058 [Paraburkholderia piptadeniae]